MICFFLSLIGCKTEGGMKSLLFPNQVEFKVINHKEAEKIFLVPHNVNFVVHRNPIFKNNKLIVKSSLENHGDKFILVVNPYGGEFPCGGTTPFRISFSQSGESMIKYVGPRFSPEPPSPMEIVVPAKSKIIFIADMPLDLYEWEGAPEVLIDWAFYYFKEPYLKGTFRVILPKK